MHSSVATACYYRDGSASETSETALFLALTEGEADGVSSSAGPQDPYLWGLPRVHSGPFDMRPSPRQSRAQERVLWIVVALVVLMLIVPPWVATIHVAGSGQRVDQEWPTGYAPIFAPPAHSGATGIRVDLSRLLLQVVALLSITAVVWRHLGRMPDPRIPEARSQPDADSVERAYRSLGVERAIGPEALREIYRDLVRVWHPDRFRDDPAFQERAAAKLREVNRAFERIQASRSEASWPRSMGSRPAPKASLERRWGWRAAAGGAVVFAVALLVLVSQWSSHRPAIPSPLPTQDGPPPEARSPARPSVLDTMTDDELLGGSAKSPTVFADREKPSVQTGVSARPPNGMQVRNRGPRGSGMLTIDNGTPQDAIVVLVDEDRVQERTRWAVYVRGENHATLRGIGAGSYRLQFSLGTGWDSKAERFRADQAFLQFIDPLRFAEEHTGDGVRYQTYTATLHTRPGGNAPAKHIAAQDFTLD